jgi:CDI immunity proteins
MSEQNDYDERVFWGDRIFADHVSKGAMKHGGGSLAELNRQPLTEPSAFRSGLIDRWERAWQKPLNQLQCSEVLTLLGQRDGLPWLARAVSEFVASHSDAEVDYYPGDLTLAALRLYPEIQKADPQAARLLAATDFSWMHASYSFSRDLQREAESLVKAIEA